MAGLTAKSSYDILEQTKKSFKDDNLKNIEANITAKSIKDIPTNLEDDALVYVKSYHKGKNKGGGYFTVDNSMAKNKHNGGTIIAIGKTFPTDWNDQAQVTAWFDGSGEAGSGCLVRNIFEKYLMGCSQRRGY